MLITGNVVNRKSPSNCGNNEDNIWTSDTVSDTINCSRCSFREANVRTLLDTLRICWRTNQTPSHTRDRYHWWESIVPLFTMKLLLFDMKLPFALKVIFCDLVQEKICIALVAVLSSEEVFQPHDKLYLNVWKLLLVSKNSSQSSTPVVKWTCIQIEEITMK
jgi:hypothetical protein